MPVARKIDPVDPVLDKFPKLAVLEVEPAKLKKGEATTGLPFSIESVFGNIFDGNNDDPGASVVSVFLNSEILFLEPLILLKSGFCNSLQPKF